MANTTLTPSLILREIYAIMHQTSNFLMRLNRQYDDRFSLGGVKGGEVLDVRLPAKVTSTKGNAMTPQNYVERSVPLPRSEVRHVGLNFGQQELSFSIQDFSARVLRPVVSQMVADVEAEVMQAMYKLVPNYVGVVTTTDDSGLDYLQFQQTARFLSENLAPRDMDRTACINPESTVVFNNAVKGLFQDSSSISEQYVEGVMGRTGGYNCYENTLLPAHTTGTFTSAGGLTVSTSSAADEGVAGTGNAYDAGPFDLKINSDTSYALLEGDILTIEGVNEVHPETKQDLGYLKRFVVAEDSSGTTTGTVPIRPAPILAGAYQNVSGPIVNTNDLTLHGPASGDPAITYGQNLMFHKDAFAFVTADLEDPSAYGAWGGRMVQDNLSFRIWRQGDIANGAFPVRLDMAYGFAGIYPEWCVRHTHVRT